MGLVSQELQKDANGMQERLRSLCRRFYFWTPTHFSLRRKIIRVPIGCVAELSLFLLQAIIIYCFCLIAFAVLLRILPMNIYMLETTVILGNILTAIVVLSLFASPFLMKPARRLVSCMTRPFWRGCRAEGGVHVVGLLEAWGLIWQSGDSLYFVWLYGPSLKEIEKSNGEWSIKRKAEQARKRAELQRNFKELFKKRKTIPQRILPLMKKELLYHRLHHKDATINKWLGQCNLAYIHSLYGPLRKEAVEAETKIEEGKKRFVWLQLLYVIVLHFIIFVILKLDLLPRIINIEGYSFFIIHGSTISLYFYMVFASHKRKCFLIFLSIFCMTPLIYALFFGDFLSNTIEYNPEEVYCTSIGINIFIWFIYLYLNRHISEILEKDKKLEENILSHFKERLSLTEQLLLEKLKEILKEFHELLSRFIESLRWYFFERWRGCTSAGIVVSSEQHGLSLLSAHLSTIAKIQLVRMYEASIEIIHCNRGGRAHGLAGV